MKSCFLCFCPPSGKPVMIITEYMENGSLDTFLKVRWQRQETGRRCQATRIFFWGGFSIGGVLRLILISPYITIDNINYLLNTFCV